MRFISRSTCGADLGHGIHVPLDLDPDVSVGPLDQSIREDLAGLLDLLAEEISPDQTLE
jgi:hypothetical protein